MTAGAAQCLSPRWDSELLYQTKHLILSCFLYMGPERGRVTYGERNPHGLVAHLAPSFLFLYSDVDSTGTNSISSVCRMFLVYCAQILHEAEGIYSYV